MDKAEIPKFIGTLLLVFLILLLALSLDSSTQPVVHCGNEMLIALGMECQP